MKDLALRGINKRGSVPRRFKLKKQQLLLLAIAAFLYPREGLTPTALTRYSIGGLTPARLLTLLGGISLRDYLR